jgi:hypothetical protein
MAQMVQHLPSKKAHIPVLQKNKKKTTLTPLKHSKINLHHCYFSTQLNTIKYKLYYRCVLCKRSDLNTSLYESAFT